MVLSCILLSKDVLVFEGEVRDFYVGSRPVYFEALGQLVLDSCDKSFFIEIFAIEVGRRVRPGVANTHL